MVEMFIWNYIRCHSYSQELQLKYTYQYSVGRQLSSTTCKCKLIHCALNGNKLFSNTFPMEINFHLPQGSWQLSRNCYIKSVDSAYDNKNIHFYLANIYRA